MKPGRLCRVCYPPSKLRDRIRVAYAVLRGRQPKVWGGWIEYNWGELRELHVMPQADLISMEPYDWTPVSEQQT